MKTINHNQDLFDQKLNNDLKREAPLADRMRPEKLGIPEKQFVLGHRYYRMISKKKE